MISFSSMERGEAVMSYVHWDFEELWALSAKTEYARDGIPTPETAHDQETYWNVREEIDHRMFGIFSLDNETGASARSIFIPD